MTDLRALFPGHRWRWSADHEPGSRFDPYHIEIPGRYGSVYLHGTTGGTVLQAYTDRRGIRARLQALPGVTVWQAGSDEMTVLFTPKDAPPVLALLRCYRKGPGRSADGLAAIRPAGVRAVKTEGKTAEDGFAAPRAGVGA